MFTMFNSRASTTECRYLSISTHSRIRIQSDFPLPEFVDKTFDSVLDAFSATRSYATDQTAETSLMTKLVEYRYLQDLYYRHLIEYFMKNQTVLLYESDNTYWGGYIDSVSGRCVGRNVIGKVMMQMHYEHLHCI
jgi:hypothetical protein